MVGGGEDCFERLGDGEESIGGAEAARDFETEGVPVDSEDAGGAHEVGAEGGAESDGALAEDGDVIAKLDGTAFGGGKAGGGDGGEEDDLFVGEGIGDGGEVGLGVRDADVFGLAAIDGVAETPAAALAAALGGVAAEAGFALAAGGDGADENPLAGFVVIDAIPEFVNHANGFMADGEARADRIFPFHDMNIRSTNGSERDLHDGFADTGTRYRLVFNGEATGGTENGSLHTDLAFRVKSPSGSGDMARLDAQDRAGRLTNDGIQIREDAAQRALGFAAADDEKIGRLLDNGVAKSVGDGAEDEMGGDVDGHGAGVGGEIGFGVGADAIPIIAGIDGRITGRPLEGTDKGEFGGIGNGHAFGGFDDVAVFHARFDGAEDAFVGDVDAEIGWVDVATGPYRTTYIVNEAGGDGAEEEAAEEAAAVGGEHDEIGTIAADDVFDDADGVAGLADELRLHLGQVFSGEGFQALGFGLDEVLRGGGGGGDLPAEFGGVEDLWSAGADELKVGLEALCHLLNERSDGDIAWREIDREDDTAIWEHSRALREPAYSEARGAPMPSRLWMAACSVTDAGGKELGMLATQMKQQASAVFPYPTAADLMALCRTEGPCLSIFLSSHRGGAGSRPSGVELAGLIPRLESALESCGMHPQDVAKMIEPLTALTEAEVLGAGHADGYCIFRSPRSLFCFAVRAAVETEWHAEERFTVSPVLAHLDYRQAYLLLALAEKRIRLLRCEGAEVTKLAIPEGVPESVAEFIHEEHPGEHGKNHYGGVRFGSEVAREKSGHFRRDFMKAIDRGLQPLLRAQGLPLVLAGVEEETSAFSAVSNYAELLPEPVQMSPDGGATDIELAKAGKQVMKRWSNAAEKQAVAEFQHAVPGRRCTDYGQLLQAANAGQVQHLFVERGARMNGDARHLAGRGAADGYVYRTDDLINAAAVDVLLHKGMVWLMEPGQMPVAVVMAAVLRFAGDKTGQ